MNIKEIAPFLADDFIEPSELSFDIDKYSHFLKINGQKLGTYNKYLICKLHDSWVINISMTGNEFLISLNDFSTHIFADTIIEKNQMPLDSENLIFPLDLVFKKNLRIDYYKVNDKGKLLPTDAIKLDVYLYEQVLTISEDKIKIAFNFWNDLLGQWIILIVSASELNVIENQDEAWQRIFGNKFDNYYNYFKNQFNSNRYVSDLNICSELIDELDSSEIVTE
jgi:hypothetical protein